MVEYFSEYLTRLRTITLSFELNKDQQSVEISFVSSNIARLTYRNSLGSIEYTNFHLPGRVSPTCCQQSIQLDPAKQEFSFKFSNCSLDEKVELQAHKKSSLFSENPQFPTPWPVNQLEQCKPSGMLCSNCGNVLVRSGQIKHYKALPSENWAEMMDFWHCHKPHEDSSSFKQGYAQSVFSPYSGTCFVADTYVLLDSSDVGSNNVTTVDVGSPNTRFCCHVCSKVLGQVLDNGSVLKLWKWSFSLEKPANDVLSQYPGSIFVYAAIAQLIDAHAAYSFSLRDLATGNEVLVLWVLNQDIWYTETGTQTTHRGMKVVFATSTQEKELLMENRGEPEELSFPKDILDNLITELDKNHMVLAESGRHFQNAKLSILCRI